MEICKRCIADYAVEQLRQYPAVRKVSWNSRDEEAWKNIHRVYCYPLRLIIDTLKGPPEQCPFHLEHVMK